MERRGAAAVRGDHQHRRRDRHPAGRVPHRRDRRRRASPSTEPPSSCTASTGTSSTHPRPRGHARDDARRRAAGEDGTTSTRSAPATTRRTRTSSTCATGTACTSSTRTTWRPTASATPTGATTPPTTRRGTDVLVDRVQRMVRRDAHHPSIVIWSLGNEAGTGRNLGAMPAAIRELDRARPLHYEGDRSSEYVDMYSPDVRLLRGGRADRPGRRGAAATTASSTPAAAPCRSCCASTCTRWATAPAGSPTTTRSSTGPPPAASAGSSGSGSTTASRPATTDGVEYFGYGGDFGEELHDGTFIADGLLLPDRTPSPGHARDGRGVRADPDRGAARPGRRAARSATGTRSADTDHADAALDAARRRRTARRGRPGRDAGARAGTSPRSSAGRTSTSSCPSRSTATVWWVVRAVQRRRARGRMAAPGFELGAGQVQLVGTGAALDALAGTGAADRRRRLRRRPGDVRRAGRPPVAIGGTTVRTFRADAWRAPTDNDRATVGHWSSATASRGGARGPDPSARAARRRRARGRGARRSTGGSRGRRPTAGIAARYRGRRRRRPGRRRAHLDLGARGALAGTARAARLAARAGAGGRGRRRRRLGRAGPGRVVRRLDQGGPRSGGGEHTVAELQTRYTHPQENGARRGVTRRRARSRCRRRSRWSPERWRWARERSTASS